MNVSSFNSVSNYQVKNRVSFGNGTSEVVNDGARLVKDAMDSPEVKKGIQTLVDTFNSVASTKAVEETANNAGNATNGVKKQGFFKRMFSAIGGFFRRIGQFFVKLFKRKTPEDKIYKALEKLQDKGVNVDEVLGHVMNKDKEKALEAFKAIEEREGKVAKFGKLLDDFVQ